MPHHRAQTLPCQQAELAAGAAWGPVLLRLSKPRASVPAAEPCSQGRTQDRGVTHGPCHQSPWWRWWWLFGLSYELLQMGPWDPPKVPAPSSYHSLDGVRGRGSV